MPPCTWLDPLANMVRSIFFDIERSMLLSGGHPPHRLISALISPLSPSTLLTQLAPQSPLPVSFLHCFIRLLPIVLQSADLCAVLCYCAPGCTRGYLLPQMSALAVFRLVGPGGSGWRCGLRGSGTLGTRFESRKGGFAIVLTICCVLFCY